MKLSSFLASTLLFSKVLLAMDAVTDPLEIIHCSLVTMQSVSSLLGNIVSACLFRGLRAAKQTQKVSMPPQAPIQSKKLKHYLHTFGQYKYVDRNQRVLETAITRRESAVVKELLANPKMKIDINLSTALSLAIECNAIPCVSAILAHKPKLLKCESKFLIMRYSCLSPYEFAHNMPDILSLLDKYRAQEYQENVAVLQKVIHESVPHIIHPHTLTISEYAAEYQLFHENPLSPQTIASLTEESPHKNPTHNGNSGDKKSNEH